MISCIILSNREQQVLKKFIEEQSEFRFLAETDDYGKAYEAVNELAHAVLFIDIDFMSKDFDYINTLMEKFKNLRIITFSQTPSIELTVKSLRVGASGLLAVPFIKSECTNLLNKIRDELLHNVKEKSKCRIITVFSNKGGIGKTSIASNLALELAKTTKEDVALVDLNFQLGDVTTFWDLKPSFDISYMMNNLDKINKEFLLNTLERYKFTSLHILADPPYFKGADNISVKQINKLFEILKETFSYVVVDTSAGFDNKTMCAVKNSDLTFLVTVANLPALRNCQKCINLFAEHGCAKDSIQVIVNRYMENDEISLDDIENLMGQPIFAKIPNNYFTMMSAINKGVPVCEINRKSNVAQAYNELALKTVDYVYKKEIKEV